MEAAFAQGDVDETCGMLDPSRNLVVLRFSAIHFAHDEETGLFGSCQGNLYRTSDNCLHWEILPTPLSQSKYQPLSNEEKPSIDKLRIFGNNYILKQDGRVFITHADSINWKPLPQVLDFEVSESEKIYLLNKDLTVSLYDINLLPVWQSKRVLSNDTRTIGVKNESLFVFTRDHLLKINPTEFLSSEHFTDQIPISEPYLKVEYEGRKWGFSDNDILQFDEEKNQWFRVGETGFAVANATIMDGQLVIADGTLNQYYQVGETAQTIEKYELPKKIFHPDTNKVVAFQLEIGSQGCFHWYSNKKSFVRKNNEFILDRKSSDSKFLAHIDKSIDEQFIIQLIEALDGSRFDCLSVSDLNFSDNDIRVFKKFIDAEEQRIKEEGFDPYDFTNLYTFPGENTDFDFYKKTADALFDLPDEVIDKAFWQAYGNWSTTTDWRKIEFTFQDGKKLIVENTDDKPNYLYTPWVVNYEGLIFRSNSIRFGQLLAQLTENKFFFTPVRESNYAIFKIADYLYRQQLKE